MMMPSWHHSGIISRPGWHDPKKKARRASARRAWGAIRGGALLARAEGAPRRRDGGGGEARGLVHRRVEELEERGSQGMCPSPFGVSRRLPALGTAATGAVRRVEVRLPAPWEYVRALGTQATERFGAFRESAGVSAARRDGIRNAVRGTDKPLIG